MPEDIKAFEKSFHNDDEAFRRNRRFIEAIKPNLVFFAIEYAWKLARDIHGKNVLDYGCGNGFSSAHFSRSAPALIVGFDISRVRIRSCSERQLSSSCFLVGDCERPPLKGSSFDFVFGNAILHHVDIQKSLLEVNRLLRPAGKAVFVEPLGMNPLIELVRKLTPHARTPGERPLTSRVIGEIHTIPDFRVTEHYLFFSVLLFIPVYSLLPRRVQLFLCSACNSLDGLLFRAAPFLKRLSWVMVLEIQKSRP